MVDIGKRLKKFREQKNLTQLQLAEKVDVSDANISQIENRHYPPVLNTIIRICEELDIPPYELFITDEQKEELQNVPDIIIKIWNEINQLPPDKQDWLISHCSDLVRQIKS